METHRVIHTQGQGFESLQQYFELFSSKPPRELSQVLKTWPNHTGYDSPHGFLGVKSDGSWGAQCHESCVEACKKKGVRPGDITGLPTLEAIADAIRSRVPGVTVSIANTRG